MTSPQIAATPRARENVATESGREGGLDALRAIMTLLVIFHHAALTYGAIGGWFYREVPTDGRLETKFLILFCTVNQAWFMGLFFLIAGYLTPGAVARHGAWGYLKERCLRLGIPLLTFGFFIGPLTIALAQTARGKHFGGTLPWLWDHRVFENGPLWFAQALLKFSLLFLAWRWVAGLAFEKTALSKARSFPSNRVMIAALLVTGAGAFALRLVWPVGENFAGLQLGYFSGYIVLFTAGCAGAPGQWLNCVPYRQRRLWLRVAWVALPIFPAVTLLAPLVPALRGNSSGGWNIQAVVYAFWEPLVAWGFILALLDGFGRRFKSLGPIWQKLARRAYAIFIIHPPVLVAVALAWRDVSAPHLAKFVLTGAASCLICFVAAGLLLRVPAIRRVV